MGHAIRWMLGFSLFAMIFLTPIMAFNTLQKHQRNLRVVEPNVLLRSGQLTPTGLQLAIREHGIRTVISLRYAERPGEIPQDAAEEQWCREHGIRYQRIQPRRWTSADGQVPAEIGVREFLETTSDSTNHPILIHCFAGIHRTGSYCAVFRMAEQGWTPEHALRELKHLGYDQLEKEWDVYNYLRAFEPTAVRPESRTETRIRASIIWRMVRNVGLGSDDVSR